MNTPSPESPDYRRALFLTSAAKLSQCPPDEGWEIAFAGRSNAGKSSAINSLTKNNKLARTSKTPGRTQLINFFELSENQRLVDLPGYGFAKVSKQMRNHWDQVLTAYLLERKALKGVVIVVDIRRGIGDLDLALIDMIAGSLPVHILLTKSDKLSRAATQKAVATARAALSGTNQSVSTLSILTRQGLESLEQKCLEWLIEA